MLVNNSGMDWGYAQQGIDWGFGPDGDDWSSPPAAPLYPIPEITIAIPAPVTSSPEPRVTTPVVTPAPTGLDRSATLGDLATLGGVLSMIFFIFKG